MMRKWIVGLMAVGSLIFSACSGAADAPTLFDKPLREQHLTLPPGPDDSSQEGQPKLSCWYYPGLMVKELGLDGIKGAAQLSMVSTSTSGAEPACRRENIDGEHVVDMRDWSGHFRGVRQGYVFFGGDDGVNGGDGFAVYDSSNTKVFADVADALSSIEPMLPRRDPQLRPWYYSPLLLNYRKVYVAPCSMRSEPARCWALVKRATGLAQSTAPDCETAYKAEEKTTPPDGLDSLRKDPSVIVYAVEAVIDGQGVARLTPKSPVLKCYPAP
ncbi:hypothetical protein KK141_05830 [Dyella sp. LX-66]|uniref:hypothetical protein n=1 Tax=unclassified Dyella TaxID=2634549 RepID=UPI001BDFE310|nr:MULTISPECIES: hypothetical protein [unclassified Dyella]MBT2116774.1 hypothetical protein [Dyella sp. LX-1]MBT2139046.1 hypothetical protein [Dyella sp. LX-66]